MKIGEFFVQLGVKTDTMKLNQFVKSIGEIPVQAAAAIIALAGIHYEIARLAQEAIDAATGFSHFQNQTGLSWKELQRWQIVAEQANVSAEAVATSVEGLQRNLAEIRLGRGNIAPFQLLGIGTNQNAFRVLEQLRQKIQGLDRATATNLISQMGLSPEMINILTLSEREFQKFTKTVKGMSEEQERSFLRAKLALTQLGLVFKDFSYGFLANLVEGFSKLLELLMRFRMALLAVGVVLAGIGIYFWPITAAIVALVLALEDLAVYFLGGDSLIGQAVEGLKKLAKSILSVPKLDKILAAGSLMLGSLSPATAVQAGKQLVNRVMNQNVNIVVHGSGSASDTAKEVKRVLDQSVSDAALQIDSAGH